MRAYHEIGEGEKVQVKYWPIGTPPQLMYTRSRAYPRDLTLEVGEVLDYANEVGKDLLLKYLFSLQQMIDRTNGIRGDE